MPFDSLDPAVLDRLFREARSAHTFTAEPVNDETIRALYDLVKLGPTAFNSQPGRYVFVRSPAAKQRLAPALSASNRDKTLAAPLTVIVAYDTRFHEYLPELTGSPNAKTIFDNTPAMIEPTAFRSSSLQGAYLIIAARSLGLLAGPMSGFNPQAVDGEFFPDGRFKSNFLINLGYRGEGVPRPRSPRLAFEDVAKIL